MESNDADAHEPFAIVIEQAAGGWKIAPAVAAIAALHVAGFAAGALFPEAIGRAFLLDPDRPGLHQFATFGFLHAGIVPLLWSLLFFGLVAPSQERRIGAAGLVLASFFGPAVAGAGYLAFAGERTGFGSITGGTFGVAALIAAAQSSAAIRREDFRLSIPKLGRILLPRWSGLLLLALFVVGVALFALANEGDGVSLAFVGFHGAAAAAGAIAPPLLSAVRRAPVAIRKDERDERELNRKLREEIRKAEPPPPERPAQEPKPMPTLDLGAESSDVAQIRDRLFAGDPLAAYGHFRTYSTKDPEGCLEPDEQWRLARGLHDIRHFQGAIECYKRLLKRHPHGHHSSQCQFHLGMIFLHTGRSRELAAEYLLAALMPPPNNIPHEMARMRRPLVDEDRAAAHRALGSLGVDDLPDGRWILADPSARLLAQDQSTQSLAPRPAAKTEPIIPAESVPRAAPPEKSPSPAAPERDKNLGQMAFRKDAEKKNPPPPPPPVPNPAADVFGNPEATGAFAAIDFSSTSRSEVDAPKPKKPAMHADSDASVEFGSDSQPPPAAPKGSRQDSISDILARQKAPEFPDPTPKPRPPQGSSKPASISDLFAGVPDMSFPEPGDPTPIKKPGPPPPPKPAAVTGEIFKEMGEIWDRSMKPEGEGDLPQIAPPRPAEQFNPTDTSFAIPPKFESTGALKESKAPPPRRDAVPEGERSEIVFEGLEKKETTHGSRSEEMARLNAPLPAKDQSIGGRDEWGPLFTEERGWGSRKPAPPPPPASGDPFKFAMPPASGFHDEPTRKSPEPPAARPVQNVQPKPAPPRAEPPRAAQSDDAFEVTPSRQDSARTKVLEPPQSADKDFFFAGSGKDQTIAWSNLYSKDRSPTYSPQSRYAVIIAPASPILLREVVEALEGLLKINRDGVIHALKRRHGILASDMQLHDAARLAQQFADRGQDVSLVEQDERLDFGEPQDATRIKIDGKTVKLATLARSHTRKWKELVGLGCGQVSPSPDAAPRDAIDLFFAEPGLHIRLWRPTLLPAPPHYNGPQDEGAFHALACELAKLAPHAIQTSGFIQWTEGKDPRPPVGFAGDIEYDNYTLWYLMAHYGRVKAYAAKSAARA